MSNAAMAFAPAAGVADGEDKDSETVEVIDGYGRRHWLLDDGSDWLAGTLQIDGDPMPYWIPRHVVDQWERIP